MKFKFIPYIFLFAIAASCKMSPDALSEEMCTCLDEMEQGKKTQEECSSLAESHFLRVQDDEEALNRYNEGVNTCLGFDKIKTREDRKKKKK